MTTSHRAGQRPWRSARSSEEPRPRRRGVAEDALVLVDDVPVRLGEIGLTIWEAAGAGLAPEEIVSLVEKKHGAHPDAPRIVGEAVVQMLETGLLVGGPRRLETASTADR
jgi:hypothetical protein